jgi:tRNA-dihydrouridine synthase
MNFWEKMKKPICCLAPMADVTDAAFRFVIAKVTKEKVSGNFVTYTEFVSADGLVLAPEMGKKKLLKDLKFSEIERPIVAQLFTNKPEMMERAAGLILELGFDGLDINMGCPDKSIEKQGAGAALIKNPKLAREIIAAAKRGVQDKIPVSVKTRLGYNKDELEEWLPELLAENPAAIIVHARTRKEMSKVPAKWERIKKAVEIRDDFVAARRSSLCSQDASHISLQELSSPLIIGNGDVLDTNDAQRKCEESGADGAMLGRAIFGNPWLFADYKPDNEERLKVLLEHIKLFDKKFAGIKNFAIMKKHFKEYLKGELRDLKYRLMRTETAKEAEKIIRDCLNDF